MPASTEARETGADIAAMDRPDAGSRDARAASPPDSPETDREGYLRRRADWRVAWAEARAAADGCELTDAHWEVMNFLQEYYELYEIAPAIRILTKQMGKRFGKEKGNSKYLYELFPRGPAKQACLYAGLPKPTGCV